MDDTHDAGWVLERLRAGDPYAAELLVSRFSGQLCRLARQRLGLRYRRKLDYEDIVQSVFKSFIRLQAADALTFENWDALWGFLSLVAIRKCGHRIAYFEAARRSIRRERPAEAVQAATEMADADLRVFSRDPSPSHVAMLQETVARLLEPLSELERRIVTLALEGTGTAEISDNVGRSERTVQRVLKGVRDTLRASLERMDSPPATRAEAGS